MKLYYLSKACIKSKLNHFYSLAKFKVETEDNYNINLTQLKKDLFQNNILIYYIVNTKYLHNLTMHNELTNILFNILTLFDDYEKLTIKS